MRMLHFKLHIVVISVLFVISLFSFFSCDLYDVDSVEDVEIFELSEGDVITEAKFGCNKVKVFEDGEELDVYYMFLLAPDISFDDVRYEIDSMDNHAYIDGFFPGQWHIKVAAKIGEDGEWGSWSETIAFTAESSVSSGDVTLTKVSDNELKLDWPDVDEADEYRTFWYESSSYTSDYGRGSQSVSEFYCWLPAITATWTEAYFRVSAGEIGVLSGPILWSLE